MPREWQPRAFGAAEHVLAILGRTFGLRLFIGEAALGVVRLEDQDQRLFFLSAAELLPLPEFSSTSEFLQQAQRRYTVGVHHRNWLALAEAFVSEASRRGGCYKTGRCKNHKCWREAIRFVAVSQEGAGAFLNAIPMRDDMKIETWAMRITVQRRLGLPLDVACQAV